MRRGKRNKGFTLIEMLVVVMIVGVVLATVVVAISSLNSGRKLKLAVQHLRQVIISAKAQAILMPQVLSLRLTHQGYTFYELKREEQKGLVWVTLRHDTLSSPEAFGREFKVKVIKILDQYSAHYTAQGRDKPILFLPSGEVTPFVIAMSDKKGRVVYHLTLSNQGKLTLKRIASD